MRCPVRRPSRPQPTARAARAEQGQRRAEAEKAEADAAATEATAAVEELTGALAQARQDLHDSTLAPVGRRGPRRRAAGHDRGAGPRR